MGYRCATGNQRMYRLCHRTPLSGGMGLEAPRTRYHSPANSRKPMDQFKTAFLVALTGLLLMIESQPCAATGESRCESGSGRGGRPDRRFLQSGRRSDLRGVHLRIIAGADRSSAGPDLCLHQSGGRELGCPAPGGETNSRRRKSLPNASRSGICRRSSRRSSRFRRRSSKSRPRSLSAQRRSPSRCHRPPRWRPRRPLPQWDCAPGVDYVTIHLNGYPRKLTGGEICNPYRRCGSRSPADRPDFPPRLHDTHRPPFRHFG